MKNLQDHTEEIKALVAPYASEYAAKIPGLFNLLHQVVQHKESLGEEVPRLVSRSLDVMSRAVATDRFVFGRDAYIYGTPEDLVAASYAVRKNGLLHQIEELSSPENRKLAKDINDYCHGFLKTEGQTSFRIVENGEGEIVEVYLDKNPVNNYEIPQQILLACLVDHLRQRDIGMRIFNENLLPESERKKVDDYGELFGVNPYKHDTGEILMVSPPTDTFGICRVEFGKFDSPILRIDDHVFRDLRDGPRAKFRKDKMAQLMGNAFQYLLPKEYFEKYLVE